MKTNDKETEENELNQKDEENEEMRKTKQNQKTVRNNLFLRQIINDYINTV